MRSGFFGGRGQDRGLALLAAIWLSLAISVLALGVSREGRVASRIAANEIAAAQNRARAEGALHWALLALVGEARGLPPVRAQGGADGLEGPEDAALPLARDGRSYGFRWGGTALDLSVQGDAGLFDLGTGRLDILDRLIAAEGAANRERIVTAVDRRRRALYRGDRIAWRIDRRAFESVDAFASVDGMNEALYRRLRPLLTVESGEAVPDALLAPPALFDALALDDDARAILAERRGGDALAPASGAESVVTLRIAAATADGRARQGIEARVRLRPRADPPYTILEIEEP